KGKIVGTELDWYYRNGAFAIVVEFGTHQRIPTLEQTKTEFDKLYKPYLFFIQEAPLVDVRASQSQNDKDKSEKPENKPDNSSKEKSDKNEDPSKNPPLSLGPKAAKPQCRLALRERLFFRGAKDDFLMSLTSPRRAEKLWVESLN